MFRCFSPTAGSIWMQATMVVVSSGIWRFDMPVPHLRLGEISWRGSSTASGFMRSLRCVYRKHSSLLIT
jgi:hypothetical protein